LKIKLDENMPRDAESQLKQDGYDVMTVIDEGLAGEPDPPVLKAAADEGRILLTFDLDFANIRQFPPGTHAGIVVFRLQDQRWETLKGPLRRTLAKGGLDDLEGGLAIVSETRARFKRPKA
jgi:predicted nuclease of predicted toxin-antitoxin system